MPRVDWAEMPAGQFMTRVAFLEGRRLTVVGHGSTWFWRLSQTDCTLASGTAVSLYAATAALERLLAQQPQLLERSVEAHTPE
ncbi:hypothetical protein [Paracraurococcus lichenis]|uniref:Uncharacterized protein n=1 Tax=Paracraurococcus lichenis TaxID=3064888 RepID=A0ABT9EBM5_9PROT|nr:hypothetical protein [Paracraurococcus sp. LOR1-02]MDO9713598.1 hypothetical protein [Paracraurococcus sp. LOR1-02]